MFEVTFNADKTKVAGPKSDGGFMVQFETGEYEQMSVAKLMMIPQGTPVTITVKPYEQPKTGGTGISK